MATNTYLVECSHENATIKDPIHNTYFTNKCGDGIQLNVGDKVSVASSYIHEIGSGSESIEFDGETVGTQSIVYTDTINNIKIPQNQTATVIVKGDAGSKNFTITTPIPIYYNSIIYTLDDTRDGNGNSIEKADNVTVADTTTNTFDNSFTQGIILSKALNKDIQINTDCYIENSWLSSNPSQLYRMAYNSSFPFTMMDNLVNISYSYYKNADAKNCMILPRLYFANQPFPLDAFDRYHTGGTDTDDGLPVNYTAIEDSPIHAPLYRRTHDNSRYKIFEMVDTVPSVSAF
eukprot:SAG11_NODE_883_length_6737_cov_10.576981_4_plen_290_part_00